MPRHILRSNSFVCAVLIVASLVNFIVFGLLHERSWKDAAQYNSYAVNIESGHGFSLNGKTFDNIREPGYPFFVAAIYASAGRENYLAVGLVQAFLLGLSAFMVYRLLRGYDNEKPAFIAGLIIALLPSYGFYANEILTETLFTFLLVAIFAQAISMWKKGEENSTLMSWIFLGLLCGVGTLVRSQLVFFLPLLICTYLLVLVRRHSLQKRVLIKMLACVCMFGILIGSWLLYVHMKTGTYSVTKGRMEMSLYVRSQRSYLSYGGLTRYLFAYLKAGINNAYGTPFLNQYDYHYLQAQYAAIVATGTDPMSPATIKKEEMRDLGIISSNLGHYIYEMPIEAIKLLYFEPNFAYLPSQFIRRVIYMMWPVIYAFFFFGLWQSYRNWRIRNAELAYLSLIAVVFIAYNIAIISFFDAAQRYNTPYLLLYIFVGFIGVRLMKENRIKATDLRR